MTINWPFVCMVYILEMSDMFQDMSLQTRLAHQFVNVSLLCNSFRGVISANRKGKRPTLNWLHIIDMLSNFKSFHEYNLDDNVDGARIYALLSYGKKWERRRYIRLVALHHGHDNRQISNNASPNRRCIQRACPLCQISHLDLEQEPRPKPRADRTSWS